MPPPKAVSSCCAIGCAGTRIAIVSWPPVIDVVHVRRARQHHRQRAGPEALGQAVGALGHLAHPAVQEARAVQVHDQRVMRRPALELEDPAHRGRVLRIRTQAVDGLGRETRRARRRAAPARRSRSRPGMLCLLEPYLRSILPSRGREARACCVKASRAPCSGAVAAAACSRVNKVSRETDARWENLPQGRDAAPIRARGAPSRRRRCAAARRPASSACRASA